MALSLAIIISLSTASPALAETTSYDDMMANFKKNSAVVYEKEAKKSSALLTDPSVLTPAPAPKASSTTAPSSSSFGSFFGSKSEETPKPVAAPKIMVPPPVKAPEVKKAPAVVAPPPPVAPAVKAYVPPPPPPPPPAAKPLPPPPVVVAPAPKAAPAPAPAPAASTQGDYMEMWSQSQKKEPVLRTTKVSSSKVTTPKSTTKATAAAAVKSKKTTKTHGIMPLWLAEIVILGLFGGLGYVSVLFQDVVIGLYKAADKAISGIGTK